MATRMTRKPTPTRPETRTHHAAAVRPPSRAVAASQLVAAWLALGRGMDRVLPRLLATRYPTASRAQEGRGPAEDVGLIALERAAAHGGSQPAIGIAESMWPARVGSFLCPHDYSIGGPTNSKKDTARIR
jgi:hypothetical protein